MDVPERYAYLSFGYMLRISAPSAVISTPLLLHHGTLIILIDCAYCYHLTVSCWIIWR